jgi:hypothetical protein
MRMYARLDGVHGLFVHAYTHMSGFCLLGCRSNVVAGCASHAHLTAIHNRDARPPPQQGRVDDVNLLRHQVKYSYAICLHVEFVCKEVDESGDNHNT